MSPWRTLQWRSAARSSRARERQHVEREIEAEAALDLRPEQFEHAPGAGAEIEQRAYRGLRQGADDCLLDRLVGDVELANAVPLGGVPAEIGLGGAGALRPHRGQPLAIARERRVVGVKAGNELAGKLGGILPLAQAEERPRPFAETLDQPGLDEEPQMTRNARLRLAQDGGEVRDGQFRLPEQRQDAQPGSLGRGLERAVERLERQVGRREHRCGPWSHFARWRRCQAGI
jgi:hypothetical protein